MVGYYSRFVQNFSKVATSLTNLTTKTTKYEWTNKWKEAFQQLKNRLTSGPVLALPTNSGNFIVYSDASKNRLCCELMQNNRVIAYAP